MKSFTEAAQLLGEKTAKSINDFKVETAKEMKANIKALIAEELGTGFKGFDDMAARLETQILQKIPTAALFTDDKAKSYDPSLGFKSMTKAQANEMAQRVLFAVTPQNMQADLFPGKNAKALSIGLGSSGGYTLPEEFIAEVARKLVHTSVFLNVCRVWNGVDMIGKMPRETGSVKVVIGAELTTPANTQFSLGNITWALQKRMALTNLPQELWKFSGIDVLNLLATMFAEQFQKTEDYYYLLGSGSLQPMGLLAQTKGMNSRAIAGSVTVWQDLLKLKHSIKSQYRLERGSCAFMFNNDTIEKIGELSDDNNRPIFLDRGAEGMGGENIPAQTIGFLLGQPVLENPFMPGPVAEDINGNTAVVAATATGVFANFNRGYFAFKGQTMESKTSDVALDAFLNDGLYTRAIDYFDGKPAIPEAVGILTGMK